LPKIRNIYKKDQSLGKGRLQGDWRGCVMDRTMTENWRSAFGLMEMVETTHYLAKIFNTS
jgi:hypothetical protein